MFPLIWSDKNSAAAEPFFAELGLGELSCRVAGPLWQGSNIQSKFVRLFDELPDVVFKIKSVAEERGNGFYD